MAIREMLIGCIGVEHGDQLLAEDLGVKANTPATLSRLPVSRAGTVGEKDAEEMEGEVNWQEMNFKRWCGHPEAM
jgi:hypothetical protein